MSARLSDFRILIAPGLHDSGEDHWQSRWERLHPQFERIEQWDWDCPDLSAWSAGVGHMLRRSARPAIVVAHSFGCLATVHRCAAGAPALAGALLVAPASPHKFGLAPQLAPVKLAIPAIVVGSDDDPWMAGPEARHWAALWGAEFVSAGAQGHINAESRLGDWKFGLAQLERLLLRIRLDRRCACA
jgi:predicted alpha/beta hydrolase family esterase